MAVADAVLGLDIAFNVNYHIVLHASVDASCHFYDSNGVKIVDVVSFFAAAPSGVTFINFESDDPVAVLREIAAPDQVHWRAPEQVTAGPLQQAHVSVQERSCVRIQRSIQHRALGREPGPHRACNRND